MRKIVIQIKSYYDKGIYSLDKVDTLLDAGKITQPEYNYIVGK